jgi:hypothetical protein
MQLDTAHRLSTKNSPGAFSSRRCGAAAAVSGERRRGARRCRAAATRAATPRAGGAVCIALLGTRCTREMERRERGLTPPSHVRRTDVSKQSAQHKPPRPSCYQPVCLHRLAAAAAATAMDGSALFAESGAFLVRARDCRQPGARAPRAAASPRHLGRAQRAARTARAHRACVTPR